MKETKEMYPSWGDDRGVRLGNVKISDLHDFKEHPFHVVEDTALFELAKSIEDKGVLVPLIVRANPYGDEKQEYSKQESLGSSLGRAR